MFPDIRPSLIAARNTATTNESIARSATQHNDSLKLARELSDAQREIKLLKEKLSWYKSILYDIYCQLEPLFHDPNDCIEAAEPVPGHDDRSAD